MSDGLRVQLELDDGAFTSGIIRAGQSLQQFENQVGKNIVGIKAISEHSKGFLATLRDMTVVAGLSGQAIGMINSATTSWAAEIIKVNAEFERMNTLMRTLSTSGDPMKESVKSVTAIREMAKNAPFSLDALHQSFTRLNAAGLKPAEGLMQSLVDAVAAFGGGDDVINRASLAFQEMAGKGVVQMKELRNQLGMAIPTSMKLLARATGESYQDMMSDVHTGTVGAKDAILALQLEFGRAFGGAAQDQMKTFNGQLNHMKVTLQDLAINHIGKPVMEDGQANENGFFEKTKKQFTDLNQFLEGPSAKGMADALGEGLGKAVDGFRALIDTAIAFRTEIESGLKLAAEGFLLMAGAKGIQSAVGGIGGIITHMQILRRETVASIDAMKSKWTSYVELMQAKQWKSSGVGDSATRAAAGINEGYYQSISKSAPSKDKMNAQLASPGYDPAADKAAIALYKSELAAYRAEMATLPRLGSIAASGLGLVASAAGGLIPYLPILAMGLGAAAEYFDVFGTKAKSAYEDLRRFGAQTQEDAHKADAYVKQLALAANQAEKLQKQHPTEGNKADADAANRALKEALDLQATKGKQGLDYNASQLAKSDMEGADQKIKTLTRSYNLNSDSLQRNFEALEKSLAAQGKSAGLAKNIYQGDQRKESIGLYEKEISVLNDLINVEQTRKNAPRASELDKARSDEAITMALEKRAKLEHDLALERSRPMGMQRNPKVQDDEKIKEKATQQLEKLQGDVEAYAAGIRGADVESERLYEVWTRLKGGDMTAANGIMELVEQLREAKAEADALDKVFRGGETLTKDISSMNLKLKEQLFEAQHDGMSDVDKLTTKIKEGFYAGYGSGDTPMQKAMVNLRLSVQGAGDQSKITGAALLNMVGTKMVEDTHTVVTALDGISNKLKEIQGLSNINVNMQGGLGASMGSSGGAFKPADGAETERASHVYDLLMKSGLLNTQGASAVLGNIHQESNFQPDITSKDGHGSYGIAQWTGDRKDNLRKYAADQGGDMSDINIQVAFLLKEMKEIPGLLAQMNMAASPTQATRAFRGGAGWGFERPDITKANDPNREGFAEQAFKTGGFKNDFGSNGYVPKYSGPKSPKDPQLKDPANLRTEDKEGLDDGRVLTQKVNEALGTKVLKDEKEKLLALMEKANGSVADDGTRYSALTAEIKSKQKDSIGSVANEHDPRAAVYKELIALAQKLDETEKKAAEQKKLRTSATNAVSTAKDEATALHEKATNALTRSLAPKSGTGYSDESERVNEQFDKGLAKAKESGGVDSQEYKDIAAQKSAAMKDAQDLDFAKYMEGIRKKGEADRKATMTHGQVAEEQLRKDQETFDKWLAKATLTDDQRTQATLAQAKYMASERAKILESTPIGKQMKDWGDVTQNLQSGMTSWMNSSVEALSTLATTGKANWKSLSQSILKDLMSMSIKGLFSKMAGGAGGLMSSVAGGAGLGGLGKLFGVAHTGGILGSSMLSTRSGSLLDFVGAPRFHTGGIIGANEVPIIAQKGEGVFTPEQMSAMGARASQGQSGSFAIHNNLTVNASGGTQEQNADMAQQIQAKMESTMRQTVVNELMKQMRPGNMLNANYGPGAR